MDDKQKVIEVSPDYRCVSLNRVLFVLGNLCPDCQAKARQVLMQTRDHVAIESITKIIERYSMRSGVPVEDILSRKTHQMVNLRRRIVAEARRQNYSLLEIGRALGKDHTTILYLLRTKKKIKEEDDDRPAI